jgi:hypothetical protein
MYFNKLFIEAANIVLFSNLRMILQRYYVRLRTVKQHLRGFKSAFSFINMPLFFDMFD